MQKLRKVKDYCPALIVDSHFLSELTAEDVNTEHQRPENAHKLFGRFGYGIRNPLKNGASQAVQDMFSNVARMFFV